MRDIGQRIQLIVVDLDMTLFDSRSISDAAFAPVTRFLETLAAPTDAKAIVRAKLRGGGPSEHADRLGLSGAIRERWFDAYEAIDIGQQVHTFGDEHVLGHIRGRGIHTVLLTSGFPVLQQKKIERSELTQYFDAIIIDSPRDPYRRHKRGELKLLMQQYRLTPDEVLVVGDNPHAELAAGKLLDMYCIQMIRDGGEFAEDAHGFVFNLFELEKGLFG
jgi:putative hydrolase of the HAD superfamily